MPPKHYWPEDAKLAQGKMTEAATTLAEQLITSGNYKLDAFEKIFRNLQEHREIFAFSKILTIESSIAISTLFYTYAQPVKGSYAYAPASDVMLLYDNGDKRKAMSIDVFGSDNIIINKYPSGQSGTDPIIITRLAEMYLISAEAKGLNGLSRLNELRAARGLPAVKSCQWHRLYQCRADGKKKRTTGQRVSVGTTWYAWIKRKRNWVSAMHKWNYPFTEIGKSAQRSAGP